MTTRTYPADPQKARIRVLNDQLRSSFQGGTILITRGIKDLPVDQRAPVIAGVRDFDAFTDDNDPHHEHDFGAIAVAGHKVFWKIDYYAADMMHASEDPADPAVTTRVLTIMLAEEY